MKNLIPLSTILLAAAVCADPADPQISNVRLSGWSRTAFPSA